MVEQEVYACKSFYRQARCQRKCNEGKCPGIPGKVCLSSTGINMEAPPKSFEVNELPEFPGASSNLAENSTVKGAYF